MSYITDITAALDAELPAGFPCTPGQLRMYALLVLTTGTGTTLENVHDAWAADKDGVRPDHQSIVPFSHLSPEVRALDEAYRQAIVTVAAARADGSLLPQCREQVTA